MKLLKIFIFYVVVSILLNLIGMTYIDNDLWRPIMFGVIMGLSYPFYKDYL